MKLIFCLLVTLSVFSTVAVAEPAWWTQQKRDCGLSASLDYNTWVKQGMPCNRGNNNNSSGPSAAQIAADKAAAEQKQLADEAQALQDQGVDAFNRQDYETAIKYFQDALDKSPNDSTIQDWIQKAKDQIAAKKQRGQKAFDQSKQEGLSQLKGLSEGGDFDSGTGLKGLGSTDLGLKGIDSNSSGLKTLSNVNTDPMVVDTRDASTGLPKSVADSIPQTPAGDRVRKGFEAIQTHDWKVALAWFQDALNHEPGDPGLQRLVDLAKYTLQIESQPGTLKPVSKNADVLKQSLGNYQDFVARHPELGNNLSDWQFLNEKDPAWKEFMRYITSKLPKEPEADPNQIGVIGPRG